MVKKTSGPNHESVHTFCKLQIHLLVLVRMTLWGKIPFCHSSGSEGCPGAILTEKVLLKTELLWGFVNQELTVLIQGDKSIREPQGERQLCQQWRRKDQTGTRLKVQVAGEVKSSVAYSYHQDSDRSTLEPWGPTALNLRSGGTSTSRVIHNHKVEGHRPRSWRTKDDDGIRNHRHWDFSLKETSILIDAPPPTPNTRVAEWQN